MMARSWPPIPPFSSLALQVVAFNVHTQTWSEAVPVMPHGLHGICPVTIVNAPSWGAIMVVGGGDEVGNYQTDTVNVLRLKVVNGSFVDAESDGPPTKSPALPSPPPPPLGSSTTARPSTTGKMDVLGGRHRLGVASWGHGANAKNEMREAQGLAFGGELYVFGGFTAPFWHAMARKSWMYDLAADRWEKRRAVPIGPSGGRGISHCGQARDDTRIYMVFLTWA